MENESTLRQRRRNESKGLTRLFVNQARRKNTIDCGIEGREIARVAVEVDPWSGIGAGSSFLAL